MVVGVIMTVPVGMIVGVIVAGRRRRRAAGGLAPLPRLAVGRQRHHGGLDAGDILDDPLGGGAHRLQIAGLFGGNGEGEIDLAIGNEDFGDEATLDDIALKARSAHRCQLFEHHFLRHIGHVVIHFLRNAAGNRRAVRQR